MGVLSRYDDGRDALQRRPTASGRRYDETSSGSGSDSGSCSSEVYPGSIW